MIYLDNAATSFPKPKSVIREVNRCIKEYCGNPGRGGHRLSIAAAEQVYRTRELIAEHLCIDNPEAVIFTQNATHSLNLAIKTSIREPCHIITSDIEHNSVLRPLYSLKRRLGCDISFFNSDSPLDDAIKPLIRKDTKYIVSTLSSNVTGKKVDLAALSRIARANGLGLITDASQYIGHGSLDLTKTPVNVLCAPAHKSLFGIQGAGFAVVLDKIHRETYIEGGTGGNSFSELMPENLPERFEAGTLSTPSIVALGEGLRFINKVGVEEIEQKLSELCGYTREMLDLNRVKILGCENGICAFNLEGFKSEQAASFLSECGIAVRGGFHCAPTCHRKLGTEIGGAVRVSFSYFNKKSDLYALRRSIVELLKNGI